MTPPSRVKELDGIRGVAILLVLLFHFGAFSAGPSLGQQRIASVVALGWCGVDLFFVLSGFLITGILLDSKHSPNFFRTFYWRRALRILPLYYLYLIVFFSLLHVPARDQIWYWLHLQNWPIAVHPLAYVHIAHFWSLAIEEQFYLFWPLAVLLCSAKGLMKTSLCLILSCWLLRNLPFFQSGGGHYSDLLYRLTPFRVDSLAFGACAALIVRNPEWSRRAKIYLPHVLILSGLAIIGVIFTASSAWPLTQPMTRFGYTALSLGFAAAVLSVYFRAGLGGTVSRVFGNPVLTSLGKYSYGIYIWHVLAALLLPGPQIVSVLSYCTMLVVKIAESYLVARLSWILFEQHFLKFKDRFSDRSIRPSVECLDRTFEDLAVREL